MRVRGLEEFRLAAIATAALGFAACSGTIPGLAREPARASHGAGPVPTWSSPARPLPAPAPVYPTGMTAPSPIEPLPVPLPSAPAPPAGSTEPISGGLGAPSPPADLPPDTITRDRQIAILTDAVAALRQEIARSYAHSEELVQETRQLRTQIARLRSELAKSREENQALKDRIRTLEKRLREVQTPAPVTKKEEPQSATEPAPAESTPPAAAKDQDTAAP